MDYASSVWTPHQVKYIHLIEGVQRRATKQLPGMSHLTYYPDRLKKLKLPTLSYRRISGDMIIVFKLLNGFKESEVGCELYRWNENTRRHGNRGNSMKLFATRSRLDIRKYNFNVRVVKIWNSLPDDIVCADSVNSFKIILDKFWIHQGILYNYTANMVT